MITPINDITRHFERLGLKVKIKAAPIKGWPTRAIIEFMPGGTILVERSLSLVSCYFENTNLLSFDKCSVLLSDFKSEGYDGIGICKRCGCSQTDACVTEAGPCWWVTSDVCSACATEEEMTEKQTTLEDDNTVEGILVNIIYDCDWCDMTEESLNKTVQYLKENYIVQRRPKACR